MTLHFSTTRAIGAAIALTLGSVASAAAQMPVRKDTRPATPTPVTKDPMPAPAPAPAPMPMPADTMVSAPAMVDTTAMITTTTTTVSTGEVPPMQSSMRRFGNGFYIGVGGSAAFPQNALNDTYRTGYGVEVPIGWDPTNSPLGLRVNLGYTRLRSDDNSAFSIANSSLGTLKDPQIYQAVLDAKLRLPFGRFLGATSGLYAVGGGGAYYFRNYSNTVGLTTTGNTGMTGNTGGSVTNTFNAEDRTRFGANVGGGASWGLGRASLYVESRYVRVFTPNRDSDMVPVVVGLTFH